MENEKRKTSYDFVQHIEEVAVYCQIGLEYRPGKLLMACVLTSLLISCLFMIFGIEILVRFIPFKPLGTKFICDILKSCLV